MIRIKEEAFNLIFNKKKTIEARKNTLFYQKFKVNDKVLITFNEKKILVKIIKINKYKSFIEYLEIEGIEKTMPNIKNIGEGIKKLNNIYPKKINNEYKLLAFHIKLI